MKRIFYKYFYTDLYYNIKWSIWALIKYFKIVITMRPWDYVYILYMLKFQIELLYKCIKKNSREVGEDRIPKELDMLRCIELLNNIIEDNYAEKCGYKHSNFKLIKTKDNYYKIKSSRSKKIKKIFDSAQKLEKNEWDELFYIMKAGKNSKCGIQGWWD